MRRAVSKEQRTSRVDRCASCGGLVQIGAEPLTWVILGDRALLHFRCIDEYQAGVITPAKTDIF